MKKLFISQPMKNKSEEEILRERKKAIVKAEEILNEEVEVIDSYFKDFKPNANPLHYLAHSISFLADADVVYFVPGWKNSRGCRIEHQCAKEYDKTIIYD